MAKMTLLDLFRELDHEITKVLTRPEFAPLVSEMESERAEQWEGGEISTVEALMHINERVLTKTLGPVEG